MPTECPEPGLNPLEHPADQAADCDQPERPHGFAANTEYVSSVTVSGRRKKAKGYGYGSSLTSQAEANAQALQRAKDHASTLLTWKLAIQNQFRRLFGKGNIPLVNENLREPYRLVAPRGTDDLPGEARIRPWLGRIVKKPWEYQVTAAIPHLDTIEPLRIAIELLRYQTLRPYIVIIDTGSPPEVREQLEQMRAEDLEIHYLMSNAYQISSQPVTFALDVAQAQCLTPLLFHTHADCFLRRFDLLEQWSRICNSHTPVIGYRMSPRDWATNEWEWMVGHTALMLHMTTINASGATWNFNRIHYEYGYPWQLMGGWPDTETGFNKGLQKAGIKPVLLGFDVNHKRQVDDNLDHFRSLPGSKLYSPEYYERAKGWMASAIEEAQVRLTQRKTQVTITETSKEIFYPIGGTA